jgi:hypothetical protein
MRIGRGREGGREGGCGEGRSGHSVQKALGEVSSSGANLLAFLGVR